MYIVVSQWLPIVFWINWLKLDSNKFCSQIMYKFWFFFCDTQTVYNCCAFNCLYKSNCILTCTDFYFILLTKTFEFFLLNYILLHCTVQAISFHLNSLWMKTVPFYMFFLSIWPLKCSILVLTIYSLAVFLSFY